MNFFFSSLNKTFLSYFLPKKLTIKELSKIAADNFFLFFFFYLSKKIRLDVSYKSFAQQMIHMKYQVLFSLKNNVKISMTVVCCSRDWRLKG